jgi:hypothetical protein
MSINLAQITGSILLLLNSTGLVIFNSDIIYSFVAVLLAISLVLVSLHMKDVILESKQKKKQNNLVEESSKE